MSAPTQQEVERVIRTTEQAQTGSSFVEAIKLDAQNIEGSRYKFRISVAAE